MLRATSIAASAAIVLAFASTGALAQKGPSGPQILPPTYGSFSLNTGYLPDPHSVNLQAGGSMDAGQFDPNCWGNVAEAPDYLISYTAGTQYPLNFFVDSAADTTLLVRAPDGQFSCNDDTNGLQPMVSYGSPQSGDYNIWVGTYSSSAGFPNATLHVSEVYTSPAQLNTGGGGGGGGNAGGLPNYNLPPTFGSVTLNTGYLPDPHSVNLQAGGDLNGRNLGGNCRGWIAEAPDYQLYYTSGTTFPLHIFVEGSADTTLVINGPDGQWYCDDDSGQGLNPSITWQRPSSGRYDIYVGTYSETAGFPSVTLNISEVEDGR